MQQNSRVAGKHRKQTSPIKGRVALVAAATGTVATAGATGVALAHTSDAPSSQIELAANEANVLGAAAPQVLAIAEFKPLANLGDQLVKAVEYHQQYTTADTLARTPKATVVRPAEGTFTSGFGPRWGTFHNGIDIANATNTPILSVMDGVVIDAGAASGFGQWVRVQHEDGAVSVYGHVESIYVSVGDHVTAGQEIAGMGNRGFSTGTHLHFEIHPDGSTPVDPAAWLAERGVSV